MQRIKIAEILSSSDYDKEVTVMGWVRTRRGSKTVAFISINDGSTIHTIQVVVDISKFDEETIRHITTGTCISVTGKLVKSQGQGQSIEIQADKIEIFGTADETFPLQKKGHSLEFLREIAHLRPRTNIFGAILRIRHHLSFGIHKFFNDKGFFYLHSPIITGSDCEGAGEMFRITTLDLNNLPKNSDGSINFEKDFFGKETNLTVSGQLEGESAATGVGLIYTFGPTFRAENSNTPRHLAEFWMIEPEMAFYDIYDNMDLAEELLKYILQYVMKHCNDDLNFICERYDKELLNRLNIVANATFNRITYTEAIDILLNSKQKFDFPVKWGIDLQREHENFLVEHFKIPVIVTGYPKEIKAFYMKQNEDGKTVRAMDVLFPYIGEVIGGSQREENYNKLYARIKEMNLPEKNLSWYLEMRRFGTCPHSGFGLGLERLMLFVTGMTNVRDIIPFPRTPKSAEF
ncbi:MAG: asparagine--tRNA ligase [Bacteroidota bacterium]